jgi:hypothetical protein
LTGSQGVHWASPRRRRVARLTLAATILVILGAAPAVTAGSTSGTSANVLIISSTDAPWYSVEQYYLALANCTRTGGWVLTDGTCRGYGSGHYSAYVAPFRISTFISDRDSRPYADLLAVKALCTHTADGDAGYRLRRIGLVRWTWGENIGCRDYYPSAKAAVLASHLYFQAEKSTGGGHWKNLKNPKFTLVGIGIWRYGSRTRLVTDFYG